MASARLRNEPRECGFPGAGRAPENHGRELPALDRAAQKASRPQEIPLPQEFLEAAGPHPLGKRGPLGAASVLLGEEIQGLGHEIGARRVSALTPGGIEARRYEAKARRIHIRNSPASAPTGASS